MKGRWVIGFFLSLSFGSVPNASSLTTTPTPIPIATPGSSDPAPGSTNDKVPINIDDLNGCDLRKPDSCFFGTDKNQNPQLAKARIKERVRKLLAADPNALKAFAQGPKDPGNTNGNSIPEVAAAHLVDFTKILPQMINPFSSCVNWKPYPGCLCMSIFGDFEGIPKSGEGEEEDIFQIEIPDEVAKVVEELGAFGDVVPIIATTLQVYDKVKVAVGIANIALKFSLSEIMKLIKDNFVIQIDVARSYREATTVGEIARPRQSDYITGIEYNLSQKLVDKLFYNEPFWKITLAGNYAYMLNTSAGIKDVQEYMAKTDPKMRGYGGVNVGGQEDMAYHIVPAYIPRSVYKLLEKLPGALKWVYGVHDRKYGGVLFNQVAIVASDRVEQIPFSTNPALTALLLPRKGREHFNIPAMMLLQTARPTYPIEKEMGRRAQGLLAGNTSQGEIAIDAFLPFAVPLPPDLVKQLVTKESWDPALLGGQSMVPIWNIESSAGTVAMKYAALLSRGFMTAGITRSGWYSEYRPERLETNRPDSEKGRDRIQFIRGHGFDYIEDCTRVERPMMTKPGGPKGYDESNERGNPSEVAAAVHWKWVKGCSFKPDFVLEAYGGACEGLPKPENPLPIVHVGSYEGFELGE